MTYEQITDLLDRGFTPDQITWLTTSATAPTPVTDPAPELPPDNPLPDDTTGAIKETETAAAAPDPKEPEPVKEDSSAAVIEAIHDLKRTIQANNILTKSMDKVDQEQALEKAMAEFIRPSFDSKD